MKRFNQVMNGDRDLEILDIVPPIFSEEEIVKRDKERRIVNLTKQLNGYITDLKTKLFEILSDEMKGN